MSQSMGRRLGAEALGTALLIFFGPGAVVAALAQQGGGGELDYSELGMIALAFGLVVAVVVYAFGHVSGAHINPAVTVALAATGRFPWREVGAYVAAQLVGAVLGGLALIAAYGRQAADLGAGATVLAPGISMVQGIAAEAGGTFLLMLAVMALVVDPRAPRGWAGLMIGLSITAAILLIGPITGGSVNPARTFGPYLTATLFGGDVPWSNLLVYAIGPVLGALLAAFAYDALAQPKESENSPEVPAQRGRHAEAGARDVHLSGRLTQT